MQENPDAEAWGLFWRKSGAPAGGRPSWSKRRIMALLGPELRAGMKVLDAGSGSGFFSRYFLDRGCRVWSLDYARPSIEMTRAATEGRCEAYLEEDLLDGAWRDEYRNFFDLIFTDGLLEHFSDGDQERLLLCLNGMKAPAGILVNFVPNIFSWWTLLRPFLMPGINERPLTLKKLVNLHTGMTILKKGGINCLPIAFSPDQSLGSVCGMLVYCFAR